MTNRNIFKELADARREVEGTRDAPELDRAAATIKRFGPRFEVGYVYEEADDFHPFAWFAAETDANVFLENCREDEPHIPFAMREIYS